MLRSVLRGAIKTQKPHQTGPYTWIPKTNPTAFPSPFHHHFSSKAKKKPTSQKQKPNQKKPSSTANPSSASAASTTADEHRNPTLSDPLAMRRRALAEDEKDYSLDVGPNGFPLFTSTPLLSQLTRKDACSYFKFSEMELKAVLPEGLPKGMVMEFEESMRSSVLVRKRFLDLRDNFRRIVDPPLRSSDGKGLKFRNQIVLDGPVSCGKSITLAMLVHWARDEGWLVLYVPQGREWTHGGFFYKNPKTGLWDTPAQAASVLKDFLKYNEAHLKQLPCHTFDPISLGEGPGIGLMKGVESMPVAESSTLYDLVQLGIKHAHGAVGVVVRLRKELSLVKDMPVLIAIDQYNSWFTFSEHEEPVTLRSCRPIHARELAMVNAFRPMVHNDMMVGAFSHSTAVGKLRKDLPDVPADARVNLPRYSVDEAATVCHYYLRQRLIRREAFSDDKWKKIYYLSNGNGAEIRNLVPLMT